MHFSLIAYHDVLTKYAHKLIRKKARQLSRRSDFARTDEDDIAQELTMHLLTRSTRFDPNRAAVNTFAAAIIESGIGLLLRKRSRKFRKPECLEIESLSETVEGPGGTPVPLETLISIEDVERRTRNFPPSDVEVLDAQQAFDHAFGKLPKHLQRLCTELMSFSPERAARNLGISRRQLSNAMEVIREHFVKAGLEQN